MADKNSLKLKLTRPVCIPGMSEDEVQQLVSAMQVDIVDDQFRGLVYSNGGIKVEFIFGSDGNFSGVYAKIDNKNIALVPGSLSNAMQLFKGSPSNVNPGPGWEIEIDLTKSLLHQEENENNWTAFLASRAPIINNP